MARILVADDNLDQVTVQRKLLETLGYQVGTAMSPDETLSELDRIRPDLVVVDLRFPHAADGLALIREVRRRDSKLPMIVLSGWPDDLYGAPEESLVSRIVVKGSLHELLQTIQELLAGCGADS
jgi:CheY-like chemotaxis protein